METGRQMDVLYHIFIVISRKLATCTEKQMSLPPPTEMHRFSVFSDDNEDDFEIKIEETDFGGNS